MDLIGGYLLIALLLFSANLALLLGNYQINNKRTAAIGLIFSIMLFLAMSVSKYLSNPLSFLTDYFNYLFFIISIILFVLMVIYMKNSNNLVYLIYSISVMFFISTLLLSSQANLLFSDVIIYSLLVLITVFIVYQISKFLTHAKRQYPVLVGEFMSLFSILVFIFALTYDSTRNIDYTMFSSFLILTPTYQLIYLIIGIVALMILGVLLNESKGGNS
ncbi:peptide ABC transporter permease [Methanobrevibacter sp.]|uniref:peptide ABC transporter permease n=1 Tax=Methanobrevibacter sp. TaxID=66852 RepID=UPI0026E09FD1|nr:peptide ABC transporter permease [Methanobrevibacter sp.]MDO5823062.1 peptide ABC transporter permease [Methanobrevibacter sp.]